MPAAAASRAATASARSTASSSQLQAMPIGTGKAVTKPWTTSSWMTIGIPSRECAILYFWSRRARSALFTRISAPMPFRLTAFV